MRWPEQVLCNIIVFIGKPIAKPSERLISLTGGLYRAWCKVRKPIVGQWEVRMAGFWDRLSVAAAPCKPA